MHTRKFVLTIFVYHRLKAEVESLMADPSCVLPNHCDTNKIEQWLLKLRCYDLSNDPSLHFCMHN